jgi:hypothetical protein
MSDRSNNHRSDTMNTMKKTALSALVIAGFAALVCGPPSVLAASAPTLGSTGTFGIVSTTLTNSNTAPRTIINGSVCGTTLNVPLPLTITGVTKQPCTSEISDQGSALTALLSQGTTCTPLGSAVDLSLISIGGGTPGVIPPGCYKSTGAMTVGSTLTLNGNGVYVFLPGGALGSTAANSIVTLAGGACADNVFWAPAGAATLGANSVFKGTIIAPGITIGNSANLEGRALAAGYTVTTAAVTISVPAPCTAPQPLPPTISKSFSPNPIAAGGVSTLTITLSNPDVSVASLAAAFTDTLPSGVFIAAIPNASTTCIGTGAVVAAPNGTAVTLPATRSIQLGSCTVTVDVTSAVVGSHVNTIGAGALNTSNGSNAAPATATLTVIAGVPTLPGWGIIALLALLALAGVAAMRRQEA